MHEIAEEDPGEPTKKKNEREKKTGAQQRTKALIGFPASLQRNNLPPQLRQRGD
jgi:hypothetical protein